MKLPFSTYFHDKKCKHLVIVNKFSGCSSSLFNCYSVVPLAYLDKLMSETFGT